MVAIPAAVGLCVFAGPICDLLLYSQPEDAAGTAPSDAHGARRHHGEPSVHDEFDDSGGPARCISPVINMAVGTVVRIIVVYVLCGIPRSM